jgi:membrane protein required for colicin V production
MNELPVNVLDGIIVIVLLLSALFAFSRGFVKEILAIGGWIGAFFSALYLYDPVKPYVAMYLPKGVIADAATFVGLFVASLVVFSILSHQISSRVRDSSIGPLDRSLGFLFGLARGAIIVIVAYLLLAQLVPADKQPAVVSEAKLTKWVHRGAEISVRMVPQTLTIREYLERALDELRKINDLTGGQLERTLIPGDDGDSGKDSKGFMGYKDAPRNQLDNLIKTNQE